MVASTTLRPPPKYLALESLRGVAALLVTLFHFNFVVTEKPPIIAEGDIFVDFFFVLSGFVIAHAYDAKVRGKMPFRDFFLLRLGRLYPLHLFVLLLWLPYIIGKYLIYSQMGMGSDPTEENNFSSFGLNLLLIQSLGFDDSLSWNGPAWSISVEMAAYLIFFALVSMLGKIPGKFLFPIVAIASYTALIAVSDTSLLRTYDYGILRCTGGFFAGAALRMWTMKRTWDVSRVIATIIEIFAIAIMLACVSQIRGSMLFEGLSFLTFIIVIYVFSAQENGAISQLLKHKLPVYLGTISYSIYMVHAIVAFAALDIAIYILKMPTITLEGGGKLVTTPMAPLFIIVYLALIILLSHLTFNWIEKPFRDRTKNWVKARNSNISDGDKKNPAHTARI